MTIGGPAVRRIGDALAPRRVQSGGDMQDDFVPVMAIQPNRWHTELERARRRRDQAAQGSPDWDAASEAVVELEAKDAEARSEQPHRKLFLVEARTAS